MAEANRYCGCGCGMTLSGPRQQRYVSDAHRKRAVKARATAPSGTDAAGAAESGYGSHPTEEPVLRLSRSEEKVAPAVEEWVREHSDLPAPLVASARALAKQVDLQPAASPLWGRLSTVLTELVKPTLQQQSFSRELRAAIEYVALAQADEEWRFQKYQEAVDHGDPYAHEDWLKVVPISCVHGRHRWKRPNYWGEVLCEYCDTPRHPVNSRST